MSRARVPLLAARDQHGGFVLKAPRVGVWSAHPVEGSLVGPGSPAGALKQLGLWFALAIPEGVTGRVAMETPRDHAVAVGFGDPLFRVVPISVEAAAHDATGVVAPPDPDAALHVTAPTDGVFYRSPSPGAKAYVVAGDRVVTGQVVGLIEVMKTFNPIAYGGATFPDAAEVVEVLAADGQEVRAGQPLIAFR